MDANNEFKPLIPATRHVKFVPNVKAIRFKDAVKSNSETAINTSDSHRPTSDNENNSSKDTNKKSNKFKNRNFVQTGGFLEGTSKFRTSSSRKTAFTNSVTRTALSSQRGSNLDNNVENSEFDQICNDVENLDINYSGAPIEVQSIVPKTGQQFERIFSNENTQFSMLQIPNILPDLHETFEGPIGKLVQYKSGQWKCIIGNVVFDLLKSTFNDDAKQICSLTIDENNMKGDLIHLGNVNNLYVLSPHNFNINE